MPIWPVTVPFKPTSGLTINAPSGQFIKTQMDRGAPLRRRVSTSRISLVSLVLPRVTKAQLDDFEAWFQNDLAAGALTFTARHPLTGIDRTWAFASEDAPYQVGVINNQLRNISMTLELYPL